MKNNWFTGEIKKDEKYLVSVTFDFPNKTANVGTLIGIELPDGRVRLNSSGEVEVMPLLEFLDKYSDFVKAISPAKKQVEKEEEEV